MGDCMVNLNSYLKLANLKVLLGMCSFPCMCRKKESSLFLCDPSTSADILYKQVPLLSSEPGIS